MHDRPSGQRTSPLTWLMCSVVAGFLIQMVLSRWFRAYALVDGELALTVGGLKAGRVWTLVTYGFLHSPTNLLHIVINLVAIYFLGHELMPMLGTRRFFGLYGTAIMLGGLAWAVTQWRFNLRPDGVLYGATAGVDALLIVFACFFPNQEKTVLFFFMPVQLKPKHVALAVVLFDLFGFVFYEVMGAPSPFGFAHSAHLAGMLVGLVYYRFLHDSEWRIFSHKADITLPQWMKGTARAAAPAPAYRVDLSNRSDVRAEVDRILDKINSEGFGALTADEKHLLDEARDLLSRR
jgi:membrane associated rhomboid family serine protease